MPTFFREPLVHFLVLGVLLFVADGLLGRDDGEVSQRIEVGAADLNKMRGLWTRTWSRPPNADELRGLVEQHVREEILYREAKALGLDRDDTIVRRRLAQKLEFLSEDLQVLAEPDEAAIVSWYQAHSDAYLEPERTSFVQIYFSRDRRGKAAASDARNALVALRVGPEPPASAAKQTGDPSLLQSEYARLSPPEVARHLGTKFADQLGTIAPGNWSGPVESSLGIHLVYVLARQPGYLRELDDVRAQVVNDFERDRRESANRAFYDELRARYTVEVDEQALAEFGT